MENNKMTVQLGDGVADAAKVEFNDRAKMIMETLIDIFFDYLEQRLKAFSDAIQQMRNRPETTQEIIKMWSDSLSAQGLIPSGYAGLPDELLIHNFHQEGYLDGLYAGYALALAAMADNNVPQEAIIAVRNAIRPNLLSHSYEKRAEFTELLKNEKYEWISKEK